MNGARVCSFYEFRRRSYAHTTTDEVPTKPNIMILKGNPTTSKSASTSITTNMSKIEEDDALVDYSTSRPFDEVQEDKCNQEFYHQLVAQAGGPDHRSHEPIKYKLQVNALLKFHQEEAARLSEILETARAQEEQKLLADKNSDDNHDTTTERKLSEDIYALIYIANPCSQAFFFAFFIFVLQECLLIMILGDLMGGLWMGGDELPAGNPLGIPAGVPLTVNIAQAIAMVLIVVTILGSSGDLTHGICRLLEGYQYDERNPHAHCWKWFLAGFLQSVAGISMTVVLFLLVLQSTTALAMSLNFAALSFIYEIDNVSFQMGLHGFLSKSIWSACQQVSNHEVPIHHVRNTKRIQRILVFLVSIAVFVPFGYLVHKQWACKYYIQSTCCRYAFCYVGMDARYLLTSFYICFLVCFSISRS